MADTIIVLAQSMPAAATLTDLYTVPGATSTVVSSVTVCNQVAMATSWRLSVAIAGAANSGKQYLYYDLPHQANDTFIATIGLTLGAGDVVRVYSTDGNLSFNLSGVEET